MADTTAQGGFYAARPVIRVDGRVQEALGADLLQSFFAEETTLGLFRCEARFQNWGPKNNSADFLFFDRAMLDFGKPFAIEVGPPDSAASVFAGRITALEAVYAQQQAPELTVLAEDRFQDLRMERRTRTFENVTDADAIRQIASQQGLTAQVEIEGPTHRVLAQVNQSDLAFIRERAASVDAQIWIDNRTLYAQSRSRRNSGEVNLTYAQNLIEFSVMADLSHQRTSVRVSGWDVGGKQAIDEEATESAISAELNGGRSGPSTLGSALAERKERITLAVPLSSQEAKAMAEARFRDRARRFITGVGVADGNPKIRVGSVINVDGVGSLFNGKYYVTLARHSFDLRSGYKTRFEIERPGIGG